MMALTSTGAASSALVAPERRERSVVGQTERAVSLHRVIEHAVEHSGDIELDE